MIRSRHVFPVVYVGAGIIALLITIMLNIYLNNNEIKISTWIVVIGPLALWSIVGLRLRLYSISPKNLDIRILSYAKAYIMIVGVLLVLDLFLGFEGANKDMFISLILILPIVYGLADLVLSKIIQTIKRRKPQVKQALVAGVGSNAEQIERSIFSTQHSNYQVKGFIECNKKEECIVSRDKVVGSLDDIHHYLRENPVDEIVIALTPKQTKKIKNIINAADYYGVRVKYVPDYEALFGKNYKITRIGDKEAVNVRQLPLDETYAFVLKNTFDKLFSIAMLILLAPLFLVISAIIKLESPGPIFYCPVRIGKSGKPFRVFKFRSMRENDSVDGGTLSTQLNDARVTKIGKFLRKYSLDELPQFLNVLMGDMSVVGPRPHRSYLNQQFQKSVDKYMIRHYFKPGITGWAQVNGWRGPTETEEQRFMRTKFDLWYVENWSLALDIKIIWLTVFSRKVHKSAF